MERFHPSRWPLTAWVVLTVAADALNVDYTVGSFSLAPAVALMAGTWAGSRRGAMSQAIAVVALAALAPALPVVPTASGWGFRLGRIAAAWVAGQVAPPGEEGGRPPRRVRWALAAAAGLTAVVVFYSRSHFGQWPIGTFFAVTFLLAVLIAGFYARKIVPEPGRVLCYAWALLPYYAVALVTMLGVAAWWPEATGIPGPFTPRALLFHGFLAHLPGDLIGTVVVAYLVGAVEGRTATSATPGGGSQPAWERDRSD